MIVKRVSFLIKPDIYTVSMAGKKKVESSFRVPENTKEMAAN
jgi:hypothetical protein